MERDDFDTNVLPRWRGRELAEAIRAWVADRNGRAATGGGCRAFYSPEQWAKREESYGLSSLLILVHDGGDLAPLCNSDYEAREEMKAFAKYLETLEVRVESCTGWYSAVYPLETAA